MVRLIFVIAFIGVVILAISAAAGTLKAITQIGTEKDDAMRPAKFQRITFILLLLLMFGVTTGWLGGI